METFETEICSRCGGTGHYSYCLSFGTICFKCRGTGRCYTKRGKAARFFFENLLSMPASKLQPGMKVKALVITEGGNVGGTQWSTIEKIEPESEPDRLTMVTEFCTFHRVPTTDLYRVASTAEVKTEARTRALEYQNTLTKAGTVRKKVS